MPQQPASPPLSPSVTGPVLKNWYLSLANHDPNDVRGHLEALAMICLLLSLYAEPGPDSVLTNGSHRKAGLWTAVIRDILGVRESKS